MGWSSGLGRFVVDNHALGDTEAALVYLVSLNISCLLHSLIGIVLMLDGLGRAGPSLLFPV